MTEEAYKRLQIAKAFIQKGYTKKESGKRANLGINTLYQLLKIENLRDRYKHIKSPGEKIYPRNKDIV